MMRVTVSCEHPDCTSYEEQSAGIDDGVNVIEVVTEGWDLTGAETFRPDHSGDPR